MLAQQQLVLALVTAQVPPPHISKQRHCKLHMMQGACGCWQKALPTSASRGHCKVVAMMQGACRCWSEGSSPLAHLHVAAQEVDACDGHICCRWLPCVRASTVRSAHRSSPVLSRLPVAAAAAAGSSRRGGAACRVPALQAPEVPAACTRSLPVKSQHKPCKGFQSWQKSLSTYGQQPPNNEGCAPSNQASTHKPCSGFP
jgi:hypothetical protein